MSTAKVLYINITGISSETLKNLILAGIKCAIADGRPYPQALESTPSSFLSPQPHQGRKDDEHESKKSKQTVAGAMQSPVHELNPLLTECEIYEGEVKDIPDEFLAKFDVVIASCIGLMDAERIAAATTTGGGSFYLVQTFGFYACAFVDLGEGHTFRKEVGKDKLSDVMKVDSYLSLRDMNKVMLGNMKDRWHKCGPPKLLCQYRVILNYFDTENEWPSEMSGEKFAAISKDFLRKQNLKDDYLGSEDDLKRLAAIATAEVSPACAVLGGVLGNEVIKVISGKGEPANNILLFDGMDGGCKSFTVKV